MSCVSVVHSSMIKSVAAVGEYLSNSRQAVSGDLLAETEKQSPSISIDGKAGGGMGVIGGLGAWGVSWRCLKTVILRY